VSFDPQVPRGIRIRLLAIALKRMPFLRYVLLRRAFLKDSGWAASAHANSSVDSRGQPLAWYTYAALQFLKPRLRPEMEVFEYGAGNSTLWWASRAAFVASVESDPNWVASLTPRLPSNVDLRFEPLTENGPYAHSALARNRTFDIIVIDGFDRNNCAMKCLAALKDDGVLIWDNSDRKQMHGDVFAYLETQGFRELEFGGLGPLNGYGWATSVFYSRQNCLGI
jgi:hypothetical protein